MRVFYCLVLLSFSLINVSGMSMSYERYHDYLGFYTCNRQIKKSITFCGKLSNYTCLCSNSNSLATYAGCLSHNHRNTTKQKRKLVSFCAHYGNVEVDSNWYDSAIANYIANGKYASEIENFNKSVPLKVPFKFTNAQLDLYAAAYVQYLNNYDNSVYYGASLLGYWLLVMCASSLFYWSKFLFPQLTKKLTYTPISIWRKYISVPATFTKKKCQEQRCFKFFDFLIPTRFESIVIAGFYILVIIVHLINMEFIKGDPFLLNKYDAQIRYVADRTGIVATVMMPLVFLFAGRNNFLQWITGWNYNTFMTYHRHIARVMFMLIVIHAVCYTIRLKATYAQDMKETYLIWGVIATVCGGIILFQALLYFRRNWYETFLLIHIVMAALFVAGTWIHVVDFGYVWFVYPTVAVWCFDRLVRIIRLIYFGFPVAEVKLLTDDNSEEVVLRVIIPKPKYWKSIAGGHVFIHFLKPAYFWQSHPFTFVDSTVSDGHIVCYCKIKAGITRALYQMLMNTPDRCMPIRVGVEGPYGESTPARYADTCVFIAGGNGIPGIYSEIVDIANKQQLSKEEGCKRRLKLIWVIRKCNMLLWFHNELANLKNTNIEVTIYVTQATQKDLGDHDNDKFTKSSESLSKSANDTDSSLSTISHAKFIHGRPCLEDIIKQEISESNGSVAFVSCGHPAMVDEIRYQILQNIKNDERKRVDFYEQLQIWA